jgi:predicted metal-dependent hydrolase
MSLKRFIEKIIKQKAVRKPHPSSQKYLRNKEAARALVKELIAELNKDNRFKFNRIAIRDQKSRWGSCSSKKNLNFNYRIVFLRREVALYLVAHELCHLEQMNHSPLFWKLVEQLVPNYKSLRAELKKIRF